MKNKLIAASLVASLALPSLGLAANTTLAGWTFSQFLGTGAPAVDGLTFATTDSVVATYSQNNPPPANADGSLNAFADSGYTDASYGVWTFSNFDTNDGVDVIGLAAGSLNTVNSTTLNGLQMHLSDLAGMGLSFNGKNKLWSIDLNAGTGYTNASGVNDDFTFAAQGIGGSATVEWYFASNLVATTTITSDAFNTYSLDLPALFYTGNGGVLEGKLTTGSAGTVVFDNVQINGELAPIPEPSSYAALMGVAGLVLAASRRRKTA